MEVLCLPTPAPRPIISVPARRKAITALTVALAAVACSQSALHAQTETVVQSHPRLWITPQRLTRMKTFASENTPQWVNLKSAADSALNTSGDTNPDDIPTLGLVYQVTGNASYAQAAIADMMANAVSTNTLTTDSCYPYRTVMPDISAGLDWCYNQMTVTQRQTVATWLMDRADYIWPETNPSRAGAWGLWPTNNYYWGFLMTWPAAIAAYGDDTGTGTYSGSNRPQYHLNLALSKWNNDVLPFANGWGQGGMFAESTNYDSTHRFALILDGNLTGTGVDLMKSSGCTYFDDSILWRIHSTVPTKDLYYPLGDQPRVSIGPLSDYDRQRAYQAAADLSNTTHQAYAKYWLDTISPSIAQWSFTTAWEFLFYDNSITSADYTQALPPYYYAPGPGILLRRSDWSTNATYFGIWAGPLLESHQDRDVNGFQIFKGGWLVGNACIWSTSGILEETIDHNNLTFGGVGQTIQDGNVANTSPGVYGGYVIKQENTSEYTYFAGWGAQAYASSSSVGVNDYVRKLVYLPGDIFLVYDRATLATPSAAKEWFLHSINPITVSGRTYTFNNGQYALHGQSLLPASGVSLSTAAENNSSTGGASSYRLDVATNTGNATDYMLNVMQVTPTTTSSVPTPTAINATTGAMQGAQVGNWVVMLGKSETISGNVAYSFNGAASTQHLVVDLEPSTTYTITAGSTTTTLTSTSNGSLRFSAPAGANSVTLSPGGTATTPTASLGSLSISPTTVTGGTSATGTVMLTAAAPSAGATISLSSNSSAAALPASVTIAAGATSANFTITTGTVSANTSVSISASYGGTTQSNTLTVNAPTVSVGLNSLAVSPTSVTGGTSSTGTIALSAAAPSGGITVSLSSNSTSASVPASVTVASGATSATFTITTASVSTNTTASIAASYNGTTKSASLAVNAPSTTSASLSGLSVSPTSVTGGKSSTGTVTLSAAAPSGGVTVSLTSSNTSAATVPTSVTVAAGATTASFTLSTKPVTGSTTATLSAAYNGAKKSASLTVVPAALSSLSLSSTSVTGGTSVTGKLSLTGAAPSGGITVSLASSNTGAATVPSSVTLAAGSSSVSFTVTTKSVSSNTTVTLSAAYGGVTKTASLTVDASTTTTSSTTYSIWPSATPSTITEVDPNSVELGLKFTSSSSGHIVGVRFYKGPYNLGTHTGSLWTSTGQLLATATFTNETSSGWQKVLFSTPVAITAGTEYVVSYHAPQGEYSANDNYFASSGVTNGPLTALSNSTPGGNGVYLYGSGGFPTNTWGASNYWVDVVFTTN